MLKIIFCFKIKVLSLHCKPHAIMRARTFILLVMATSVLAAPACSNKLDVPAEKALDDVSKKIDFPISVTREGSNIPDAAIAGRKNAPKTKAGGVDSGDMVATMDTSIPFGVIGIDMEMKRLLIDNKSIYSNDKGYSGLFDTSLWEIPATITFSAYYPYVRNVQYEDGFQAYSIPYTVEETHAGPLVSKTVERAVEQLNMVPLEFQHITNDLGFKICDVTEDPQLQGLIHLRKVTATNVASAGVFVNDVALSKGIWHRQGYYRNEVVFEGDAVVGVGMENEKFIGDYELVDRMADSHRYYSIPDEILMGKQCVEVVYDVDSFTIGGYTYEPLKDQVARYMLYGVLPDNVFVYGKQYTFHLGLDTGKLYQQISFQASVSDWETKIYENNDDF